LGAIGAIAATIDGQTASNKQHNRFTMADTPPTLSNDQINIIEAEVCHYNNCQLLLSVRMVILHMPAIYIFILTAPSAVGLLPTLTLFSLPSRCSLHICLTHHPIILLSITPQNCVSPTSTTMDTTAMDTAATKTVARPATSNINSCLINCNDVCSKYSTNTRQHP